MQNIDKLKVVFSGTLDLNSDEDVLNAEYGITPRWDSITHMALIASLEDAFEIMLPTDDVIGMSSFTQAKRILSKHGVPLEA